MWNSKLSKKLEDLETENYKLNSRLNILQFKLENPPEFKQGDKVRGHIVTEVSLERSLSFFESYYWRYTLTNIKTGEVAKTDNPNSLNPKQ